MAVSPAGSSTLITVAPTGAEADKAAAPALPVTLAELVVTAKECEAAGAAVIHVHIRDDAARPTLDVGRLADTVAALREGTGLIVQLSTGGAVTDSFASRLAVLDAAPDACSLTCGTVNFGDDVFSNPWPFIKDLYQLTKERQVVPEFELFDLGHIATLHRLLAEFGPPAGGHVHCDLVMGVPGGMPGDVATLAAAVAALPDGATWSATGIGRTTLPVMLGALGAGGHLRVGMEDTLTFSRGRPVARNAELVERAADLARLAQRPPMPPAEARTFLSIPTRNPLTPNSRTAPGPICRECGNVHKRVCTLPHSYPIPQPPASTPAARKHLAPPASISRRPQAARPHPTRHTGTTSPNRASLLVNGCGVLPIDAVERHNH